MNRAVILGASNVTLSGSLLLDLARAAAGGGVAFHVAAGLGRSYGEPSAILGRTLPGILQCRLWDALPESGPGGTVALITDIGNDILYGHPVERIAGWVEACIDRLLAKNARIVVTSLPLESLRGMSPVRYHVARQIFFPTRYLGFRETRTRAERLDERIRDLARSKRVPLVVPDRAWYGLDPIHVRKSRRKDAWGSILSAWNAGGEGRLPGGRIDGRVPSLRLAVPAERWILGIRQRRDQPWRRLADGSTVSIY